jgi:uncharacterized protein
MMGIYLISIVFMIIGWLVSRRLKSKFEKYSQTPISSGMSGQEIAEMMLRDHNITDVKVISVEGRLTDHYNPMDKTVNLSHDVYHGRNAAAAAVSAHECGHAVQHATAYSMIGNCPYCKFYFTMDALGITWRYPFSEYIPKLITFGNNPVCRNNGI